MLAASAIAALAALSLTEPSPRLDAQLRSEARGYAGIGDGAADLEFAPRGTFTLHDADLDAVAAYAPMLVLHLTRASSPDAFHRGELSLSWRQPRAALSASEQVGYGTETFWLAPGEGDPASRRVDLLPSSVTLPVIASRSALDVEYALTRELRGSLGGWFQYGGGLDLTARTELPVQRTPHADAALAWEVGLRDTLTTRADVEQSEFLPGPKVRTASAIERLSHRFDDALLLELEGGPGRIESDDPNTRTRTVPVAATRLGYQARGFDRPTTVALALQLGPYVDRLTGQGYLRGDARLAFGIEPRHRVHLGAALVAAHPVDSPERGDEQFEGAELLAEYDHSREVRFGAGVRAVRQQLPADREATTMWGAFFNVTVVEEVLEP